MSIDNAGIGFLLVTAAGLATAIGAAAVYFPCCVKRVNKTFLAGALGISAGVMMLVSFVEIFWKSNDAFVDAGYKENAAYGLAFALFFVGIIVIQLIDLLVHQISDYEHDLEEELNVVLEKNDPKSQSNQGDPAAETKQIPPESSIPRESSIGMTAIPRQGSAAIEASKEDVESGDKSDMHQRKLSKMGLMTALAIGIHNFPEGLATFLGALDDPSVGAALAVAIGIHNIPEGLCVAIPIYYSTGNRHVAFGWALLSGISEPIGALIGYAIVVAAGGSISPLAYGILFGMVGGMMVSICIKELLPTAFRYDPRDKVVTYAFMVGMAVMALSLVLFALASPSEDDDGDE
mmetsp:Transcript_20759/g.41959  ORF Transcript_20759/g.41959 Transcript_20759/m.41959 type:complete len:348 (+) Transcript_20759:34-1077(+)